MQPLAAVQTIMTHIECQEGDARPVLGPGSIGILARLPAHRDVSGGQLNGRSCGDGRPGDRDDAGEAFQTGEVSGISCV